MKLDEKPILEADIKKEILKVLKQAVKLIEERNSEGLINLSHKLTHTSSINLETRSVYVSLIIYSLGQLISKALSKEDLKKREYFIEGVLANIKEGIKYLKKDDINKFDEIIKTLTLDISDFDNSFTKYVDKVLDFSKIQQGAKLHQHGLSLATVAKLVGTNEWDLMKKIGETKISEEFKPEIKNIKKRYEIATKILKEEI